LKKKLQKKKKDDWFINKNYLHFDSPLSFSEATILVTDSKKVAQHTFFPFIRINEKIVKYRFDEILNKMDKESKTRPISYSSHKDGYIYNYYAKDLSKKYEDILKNKPFNKSILAFRKIPKDDGSEKNKSNIEFAKDVFDDIESFGECNVIALDFSKFFDTLDHNLLKQKWSKVLGKKKLPDDHYNIYKSLTKFSFVERDKVFKLFGISKSNPKPKDKKRYKICSIKDFRNIVRSEKDLIKKNQFLKDKKGIPQGSSLSALLSNVYLFDFDEKLFNYVETFNGKYYRYCDDFIIITKQDNIKQIECFINKLIIDLKTVELNEDKTEVRYFRTTLKGLKSDKPLQYLGFLFDGQNISIRSNSISRYHRKLRRAVRLASKTRDKRDPKNRLLAELKKLKFTDTLKVLTLRDLEHHRIEFCKKFHEKIYKKKLYEDYSFLGKQNFITYGLRAKKVMKSKTIKKQIKNLWSRLQNEIET